MHGVHAGALAASTSYSIHMAPIYPNMEHEFALSARRPILLPCLALCWSVNSSNQFLSTHAMQEPALVERFGAPVVSIPNLHPDLKIKVPS
eukprot:3504970-Amphidinium_carterae.1